MRILGALDEVAADTGNTQAEIALAWIMARKGVTAPIASATNLKQLESLTKSASIILSDEACRLLNEASE
ncbi:Aldo/keto reductase family protein [compost metagenome]